MNSLIDFYEANPAFFETIFAPTFLDLNGSASFGIYSILGLRASCRLFARIIVRPAHEQKMKVFNHTIAYADVLLLHAIHPLFPKDPSISVMDNIVRDFHARGLMKVYMEWRPNTSCVVNISRTVNEETRYLNIAVQNPSCEAPELCRYLIALGADQDIICESIICVASNGSPWAHEICDLLFDALKREPAFLSSEILEAIRCAKGSDAGHICARIFALRHENVSDFPIARGSCECAMWPRNRL